MKVNKKLIFSIIIIAVIAGIILLCCLWKSGYWQKKKINQIQEQFKNQSQSQTGMVNPASKYCVEQNGTLEIRKNEAGEYGVCVFANGTECDEWEFFRGECKVERDKCVDLCGDQICQEVVCKEIGSPCAETKETCPADCKK
ncbi:MAG: DUF333 domain-containing protein [Patescibacteria group bacterium]|nr:DUF333 domain-containing protein [Patescibacteria group bacterium]MDD5164000.1 DUF333 domain-containing protein [Patescibacteria group bacterium]MDD5534916.1 DUF333 domain-containing protein [Patescibacteria group bacterium]